MPTKPSNSLIIIDFRSRKKNSSNEFLHKTWFNKALFVYFENHFRKKRTFEKKRMEEHICQQKMMAWGIFFFIGGIISHVLLETIFYNFQRYSLFKRFISTTLFDEFPTECHQYYSPSPTSMSTEIPFIKPSDLVECKPQNFQLHVVNPWRRSECQTGILFKLFCWKIYNLHFRFWAW